MANIKVFQSYYREKQKRTLDPSFTPYDVSWNPLPHLRETPLYFKLYEEGAHKKYDYTGIFSHKFSIKSKVSGEQFISFVNDNPGYDAYFINPYPQLSYLSYNIWEQGEYFHPGIKYHANQLLKSCGAKFSIDHESRDTNKTLLFANFWIGNKSFWEDYIPFLKELHNAALCNKNNKEKNPYLEETPHITPAPLYPFIFERIFSSYIKNQAGVRYLAYKHTDKEIMDSCNTPAERAIYKSINKVINSWDNDNTYTSERKSIFKALLGSSAEYEILLRKIDKHPFKIE